MLQRATGSGAMEGAAAHTTRFHLLVISGSTLLTFPGTAMWTARSPHMACTALACGTLDMQGMLSGTSFLKGRFPTDCAAFCMVSPCTERTLATLCAISSACIDRPSDSEAVYERSESVSRDDDVDDVHFGTFRDIHDGFNALVQPDHKYLAEGLRKCTSLVHVKGYHHCIIMVQLEQGTHLANLLVSMYARYGAFQDSRAVFEQMPNRNVVSWTASISALARQGLCADTLILFRRMQAESTPPNNVTLIALLGSFTIRNSLIEGKIIHACIEKDQLSDVILSTSFVTMYGRCGSVEYARILFDQLPIANLVTWNAMITVYVDHELGKEALGLFQKMQLAGVDPNDCTYINNLKACGLLEDVAQGKAFHSCVLEQGWISDLVVCNSLVNMYGKCGALNEALCVFEKMPKNDVITWNGILSMYAQQRLGAEGLELFRNMQQQGLVPEKVTFIGTISACASITALDEGKCIHACLLYAGMESDLQIGNALIHMYGRCGALGSARAVFDRIRPHNLVSWTAVIAAFSQQGHAEEALQLFHEMQKDCVKPDEVTYIAVLSACSHAGLVEEGRSCFASMEKVYGLTPKIEHYVCMIDLFGRAGLLSEAEDFIRKLPRWHDGCLWAALLSSCTIHSDTFRGKYAAEQMISYGPEETAPYVLLGNLYAANDGKKDPGAIWRILEKVVAVCRELDD